MDPDNASWFNIFNISELTAVWLSCSSSNEYIVLLVFEIVSAYGTVGLSTGVPYASAYPLVCSAY